MTPISPDWSSDRATNYVVLAKALDKAAKRDWCGRGDFSALVKRVSKRR